MKYFVLLATEREIEIDTDNINEAIEIANAEKTDEERIVRIRLNR